MPPHDPSSASPASATTAAFAAFAAFAWALTHATSGLHGLDAGDFVTAGATLGVPHATGFPAFVPFLSGSSLLPVGGIAHRAALLSALFAAVTAASLVALLGELLRRKDPDSTSLRWAIAAGAAGATAAVAPTALHMQTVDVYAASLAASVASLALLARLERVYTSRVLVMLGLLVGVGAGLHVTNWISGAIVTVAAARLAAQAPTGRRDLVAGTLLGATALLAHAWLIAAARGDTPHAWGETTTLAALLDHVRGAEIREALGERMGGTPVVLAHNVVRLARTALGPLLIVLLSASVTLRRTPARLLAGTLIAVGAADLAYAVAINPMGIIDDQVGQLVFTFLFATGTAASGYAVATRLFANPVLRYLTAASPAVVLGALGAWRLEGRWGDIGHDTTAEDLALIALGDAPPRAAAVVTSDLMTSGMLYATLVLDARPDMSVVGAGTLSDRDALLRLHRLDRFSLLDEDAINALPNDRAQAFVGAASRVLHEARLGRPVFWEVAGVRAELPEGVDVAWQWPLGRVSFDATATGACEPGPRALCGGVDASFAAEGRPWATSRSYRRWLASQHARLAARGLEAHDVDAAERHFATASTLFDESAAYKNSLAVVAAARGDFARALELSRLASDLDITSRTAISNGLLYARRLNDAAAIRFFEQRARRAGIELD